MRTLLTQGANSSTPSLPQVLVMFPLFCPLPCLRGMLEFVPSVSNVLIILTRALHEDMEVDKIIRTLLTLGANSSTPRRHGSGQNNENITNTRDKRGVLEFDSSVNNVLIILSTSMSSWSVRICP
jgi:hypothetical protein